jgi:hypothetical protein
MRKTHMQAVIDHLKTENTRLRDERAETLDKLHASAGTHSAGLAGVRDELKAARAEITRLAAAVRESAAKPEPQPEPEPQPDAAVPISKGARRSKTA